MHIWTVGEDATEGLRKLYGNKELHNLYPSPNIVRVMIFFLGGDVWCLAEVTSVFRIFVRKPEGKRPF